MKQEDVKTHGKEYAFAMPLRLSETERLIRLFWLHKHKITWRFKTIMTFKSLLRPFSEPSAFGYYWKQLPINTRIIIITLQDTSGYMVERTFKSFLFVIIPWPTFFNWKIFPLSTKFLIKSQTKVWTCPHIVTGSGHHWKEEYMWVNYALLGKHRSQSLDSRNIGLTRACSKGS